MAIWNYLEVSFGLPWKLEELINDRLEVPGGDVDIWTLHNVIYDHLEALGSDASHLESF